MREIKFRQPIWEEGKIVRWHYWGFQNGQYKLPENTHESYQFTGLKDKDGKEIYEGDIINPMAEGFEKKPFVVEMLEGYWSVAQFKTDTALEVIGNFYENPELLEAGDE